MKNKKMTSVMFAALLILTSSLLANSTFAQNESAMKDCCMMKDGKMMQVKDRKMMPMEKDMVMDNGTTCMVNGECVMKDGKKMKMKEGDCMDVSGKMDKCGKMRDKMNKAERKHKKHHTAKAYACPMHPDVTSDKADKCSKCGMDLVEKKKEKS
jgi:Heavy metal binding domain